MYGFCFKKAMGYGVCRCMAYVKQIPAYQLGNSKMLWVLVEYGLSGVWVRRVSTVTELCILLANLPH